jgi:hypothetical protein
VNDQIFVKLNYLNIRTRSSLVMFLRSDATESFSTRLCAICRSFKEKVDSSSITMAFYEAINKQAAAAAAILRLEGRLRNKWA